jgi:4-hydroxythreonine-4-phosphate dehydrogenase
MINPTPKHHTALNPIALTMGEPAGIGGEITLKAWLRRNDCKQCFFAIDDPDRLERLANKFSLTVPIHRIKKPQDALSCFATGLPVIPISTAINETLGKPNPSLASAVITSIEKAVSFVIAGEASALTTNPIQKETLYQAGFKHPGHTEFLADLAKIATPPVMMLACNMLRAVPVTVHQSLKSAVQALNQKEIIEKSQITYEALQKDFGIPHPRLAVAGLNPHAGENGALDVYGPIPPDTIFSERAREKYDAAICMYHDQALIPIKILDFDGAVNITLGLPFIRTSPDHGTALDIAESGKASPDSLIAALNMATFMAVNRYQEQPLSSRVQNGRSSA